MFQITSSITIFFIQILFRDALCTKKKKMPGTPFGSEDDEAEWADEVLKPNSSENVDAHSLVWIFFF